MFHITLQNLRKSKNLMQKEIANYLGINRVTYTNYELGKREPDYATLVKLADYYNISLDVFFDREIKKVTSDSIKPSNYKSDLHKELHEMIDHFDREDLLMLRGFMVRLNERYDDNNKIKKYS